MRRVILLLAVVACAQSETAQSDSAAMAPAAPAPLTAADVDGTWNGVTMAANTDSITARWTAIPGATATETRTVTEGTTDTLTWTRVLDADSMVVTSAAFTPPVPPNSPQIIMRAVGRLVDGKLMGTAATMLAARPDSVIERSRWEATRVP